MIVRGNIEWSAKTDLILGINAGDGCQHGFEGTERFGRSLCEFDRKCNTPEIPINPTPLLDY